MARERLEVRINPEIMKWARESAGWDVKEISRKLRISLENYEKIESGSKLPTFRQLEILANYFKRPVAIFFLSKPPKELSLTSSFRFLPKLEQEFSKDLRLAIRKARYYQSVSNDLLEDLGIDTKPRVKTLTLKDNPRESAKKARAEMGVSLEKQLKWKNAYEAFNGWRSAIEERNVLVFQFRFPIEDARGFSLMDKNPPAIAINSADNILARIFTLFHEYAHIVLGITEIYTEGVIKDTDVENWCDSFASELLISEEYLKNDNDFQSFLKTGKLDQELLENLSRKFKVSKKAILTRLRILNLINDDLYKRELSILNKQYVGIPKSGGFIVPAQKCFQEKGKNFISYILEAKKRGIITTQDIIEYLSIKMKHLDKVRELIAR